MGKIVRRWHGLVDRGVARGSVGARPYRVTLTGIALDEEDHARIHARLSDPNWSAARVRDALVLGINSGHGQLWRPDSTARIDVLHAEFRPGSAFLASITLGVDCALDADELDRRLAMLFAGDRLIEAGVEALGD